MRLTVFIPDELRVKFLASKLLNNELYLSDEYRDTQWIHKSISQILANPASNIIYEFPNFSGILGFANIIPGHKADVIFKLWDKTAWSIGLAKEIKQTLRYIMKHFKLKRLSLATPQEERGLKLAKLFGFIQEGSEKYGFRWNKKFFTLCRLRLLI